MWTRQVFKSAQYAYDKDDLASTQRPSIMCLPMWSNKNSFAYSQDGEIMLRLHFSFQKQRVQLAQNVIQIANLIQLINLNQKFTQYAQTLMPGLFWIGKRCKADYSKVYGKDAIVEIVFDYKVDLLAYSQELQNSGFDITSPDEQIYLIAQDLLQINQILNDEQEVVITV